MSAVNEAMTLRVLGAGAAFSGRYGTTCSVLTLANGKHWLVDCGRQAPEQLKEAGYSWHGLAGQLVTHVHGDHVFGLEEFALTRYYQCSGDEASIATGGRKPQLIAHSAVLGELWEVLAPSLRYRTDSSGRAVSGTLSHYFDVVSPHEVESPQRGAWNRAEAFDTGELVVTARETQHICGKPSMSFEFQLPEENGRVAWWSGDSNVDSELLHKLADRATIYFHDCTFSSHLGQVHGAFDDLAKLPEHLRTRIVLMHHDEDAASHLPRVEALGLRMCLPGDVFDLTTGLRLNRP